jgi:hypothetical protein
LWRGYLRAVGFDTEHDMPVGCYSQDLGPGRMVSSNGLSGYFMEKWQADIEFLDIKLY